MTGLLIAVVACLTMICLACLTVTAFLVWWTMGSAGQHSISAGKQTTIALQSMETMVGQSASVVTAMADLTETLLLGREIEPTSPLQPDEKPSETLPMPGDLWQQLPEGIKGTLIREWEEAEGAGIWPDPSETLQPDSEVG